MRPRLRAWAALASTALALHQLRYLAAPGEQSGGALAGEAHEYLTVVAPLIAMLVALALVELGRAWQLRRPPGRTPALLRCWGGAAVALLVIYLVQESLEGALVAGRPAGLAGVVGAGGWVALPLAGALGLGIALILRGADAVLLRRAARARSRPRPRPADAAPPRRSPWRPARAALARNLAGRSPPLTSS